MNQKSEMNLMNSNPFSEKIMQQFYGGLTAVPLEFYLTEIKNLSEKMETLNYDSPDSLFGIVGRIYGLERAVIPHSLEAATYLDAAGQALYSLAQSKEKAEEYKTNFMKSFDVFNIWNNNAAKEKASENQMPEYMKLFDFSRMWKIEQIKEKAPENPMTDIMKSFDVSGIWASLVAKQNEASKLYVETLITSAAKELEKKRNPDGTSQIH
jgi:hypothetical protein